MSEVAESIACSRPVSGVVSVLSYAITTLGAIASGVGLLIPGVYRDNAWVAAQNRGTDLVTLVIVVPAMLVVLAAYRRGSPRGRLVLFGFLGYFFYVYTGAAFAYSFNYLFLVYVVLFSLSIAALIALSVSMNASSLRGHSMRTLHGAPCGYSWSGSPSCSASSGFRRLCRSI